MNHIPDLPRAWHAVGSSRDFPAGKPHLVKLKNKEFILYRDSKGTLRATSSRCPHMGANLCTGRIDGDRIVCPFHEWKFGPDGKCSEVPASDLIPESAYLLVYPVFERHGIVALFYGETASYPFPFFRDADPEDFFSDARCFEVHQEGTWYIVPSNAFDLAHFIHVHKRNPIGNPKIHYPDAHSAQITLSYELLDANWVDWLTRRLFGKIAVLDFTVYSGNLIFGMTRFGSFRRYVMIFIEPTATGNSVSKIYTYAPGAKRGALYRALMNPVLGLLGMVSRSFFGLEAKSLKHAYIDPSRLHPNDASLLEYYNWLNGYYERMKVEARARKESITPESRGAYEV